MKREREARASAGKKKHPELLAMLLARLLLVYAKHFHVCGTSTHKKNLQFQKECLDRDACGVIQQ